MVSEEFLCNTYGLALFLVARGVEPTRAMRVGVTTIFVFPTKARNHFDDFHRARKRLSELQLDAEGAQ